MGLLSECRAKALLLTHQVPPTLPPVLPFVEPPSSGITAWPSALMNFLGAGLWRFDISVYRYVPMRAITVPARPLPMLVARYWLLDRQWLTRCSTNISLWMFHRCCMHVQGSPTDADLAQYGRQQSGLCNLRKGCQVLLSWRTQSGQWHKSSCMGALPHLAWSLA